MIDINNVTINLVYDKYKKNNEIVKMSMYNLINRLKQYDDEEYAFGDSPLYLLISSVLQNDNIYTVEYNNEIIGALLIGFYDLGKDKITLSYVIEKKYRNKGIGTHVISMVLKNCFEDYECSTIYAYIGESNLDSRRILEKNGFEINNDEQRHRYTRKNLYEYCDKYIYPYEKYMENKSLTLLR